DAQGFLELFDGAVPLAGLEVPMGAFGVLFGVHPLAHGSTPNVATNPHRIGFPPQSSAVSGYALLLTGYHRRFPEHSPTIRGIPCTPILTYVQRRPWPRTGREHGQPLRSSPAC